MNNTVVYFEVPVNDIDRAMIFYQEVFGFQFERTSIDDESLMHML